MYSSAITFKIISTWLVYTVYAFILQYYGYLVLHDSAVIISCGSGACKSTTYKALVDRGYTLLTDDVVVIDPDALQLIPRPAKVK